MVVGSLFIEKESHPAENCVIRRGKHDGRSKLSWLLLNFCFDVSVLSVLHFHRQLLRAVKSDGCTAGVIAVFFSVFIPFFKFETHGWDARCYAQLLLEKTVWFVISGALFRCKIVVHFCGLCASPSHLPPSCSDIVQTSHEFRSIFDANLFGVLYEPW